MCNFLTSLALTCCILQRGCSSETEDLLRLRPTSEVTSGEARVLEAYRRTTCKVTSMYLKMHSSKRDTFYIEPVLPYHSQIINLGGSLLPPICSDNASYHKTAEITVFGQ